MSDKTWKNPFDDNDPMRDEFSFPGAEPDDLTEEERTFTFDESYLADVSEPETNHAGALKKNVDALANAIRRQQKEKKERDRKVDALSALFGKRSTPETREEPPSGERHPVPKPAKPVVRKKKQPDLPAEPESVTVGGELRGDQMLVYDSELDEIDYTDEEDLPEMRDYMPIRFGRYGRIGIGGGVLYALFVISVSVVLACFAWLCAADVLALNKEPTRAIVVIDEYAPEGDDPVVELVDGEEVEIKVDIDQVAEELKSAGIIEYKWLFKLFSQFSHAGTKIDPGTFDVSTDLDYRALVTALQFGSDNQEITRITFPEGYSLEQIFTLLEENQIARKSELYEASANYEFDYEFLQDLPYGDPNRLEGYLFPDTYDFYQGEDATVAINRFLRNMDNKLTESMRERADNHGLSINELLTMASLIEKEAGSDDERATMASVIYNRLDIGMKLQLDSTINYINGTSTFDISTADTQIDDPYNTYVYEGLPPGPICNPGLASIEAVLYPESTDYWYWYSVDGVSTFFTDYDDFIAYQNDHPVD